MNARVINVWIARLDAASSSQPALPLVDHRTTERQNGRTAMNGSWRFLCMKEREGVPERSVELLTD